MLVVIEHPPIRSNLLRAGCDVNEVDDAGNCALHYATIDANVLNLLVNHAADVNMTNKVGATALHEAAEKECIEACKVLLCCKCHADIRDKMGMTAEDRCRSMSKMKAFHLLRCFRELSDRGFTPQDAIRQIELDQELHDSLHALGVDQNVSLVVQLLENGANVNVLNLESNLRPLHVAVTKNSWAAVHVLLEYGAATNLTQAGENKMNAVSLALVKRNYEEGCTVDLRITNPHVLSCLLMHEVDVCAEIFFLKGMSTLLHIAVLNNDPLAVKLLLAAGADPDQQDKDGRSALEYAQG